MQLSNLCQLIAEKKSNEKSANYYYCILALVTNQKNVGLWLNANGTFGCA